MSGGWNIFVYTTDEDGGEVYCGQFADKASAESWVKTQGDEKKFEVSDVRPRDRKAKA